MDKPNEHKQPTAAVGPGGTLRKARTDLHLSAEDAASQLHLAPRQILALEADDYANLPQSTYVRGYLRNYALLLGLAPEPILEAYAQATAGRKPPRLTKSDTEEQEAQRDDYMKWVSAGIAVLVLALVYAWWQGRETETAAPETAALSQPEMLPGDPVRPESAPGAISPSPELKPQAGSPQPQPQPQPQPNSPAAAPAIPARKPEPAPPAAQVPGKPDASKPATPAAAPPVQAPTPATQAGPDEPRAKLVLQVEAESWAEVRDAHQTRLIYETVPAGRIVGLEGVPPFQVFLGNVDGVKVFYQGKPFDAARYKRGTTARFSVGTAQTGSP